MTQYSLPKKSIQVALYHSAKTISVLPLLNKAIWLFLLIMQFPLFFLSLCLWGLTIFWDRFIYIYIYEERISTIRCQLLAFEWEIFSWEKNNRKIEYSFVFYRGNCMYVCTPKEEHPVIFFCHDTTSHYRVDSYIYIHIRLQN